MDWLTWLLDARLSIGDSQILVREVVGNGFGLASMLLGMRRKVITWPVGMVGNLLLLTVFLGGVFATPQDKDLWGQAGRQVFFFAVSAYGWWRWHRNRSRGLVGDSGAVVPRWATWRERGLLLLAALGMFALTVTALTALESWSPVPDAWILTGSMLATYGMARGWMEFWLLWIAVDAVGVPLLFAAGYYPSALLYLVYAGFALWGLRTWWRVQVRLNRPDSPVPVEVGSSS